MVWKWRIGTAADCEIRVDSPYVSGTHCRLGFDGRSWEIEDLGSTNGTYVNGVRIVGRMRVSPSDSVTLGRLQPLPWPDAPRECRQHESRHVPVPRRGGVDGTAKIGRAVDCDIVLDYPMVSRSHALVWNTGAGLVIRDLGSTNGTFVQGRRILDGEEVRVRPGDVIGLGSYRLTVSADGLDLVQEDGRGTALLEANGVTVNVQGRRLLQDVTMVVKPGELIGIMGPSGAGKSTLLAALVGCQPPTEGRVAVSGEDLYARYDTFRGQIGYVPQDDIMHADLTVWQTLWYTARLRLPPDHSTEEIDQLVKRLIGQLGLRGTEDVRIGSARRRGISGGQRKRVNIAMELLTDPPILVLDEPTSGLSSTDAAAIVELLRSLADAGRTVVLTIHQPSVDVMRMLDGVAVIARDESSDDIGRLVWYGPAYPDAAEFFEPSRSGEALPDAEAVLRGLSRRCVREWVDVYQQSAACASWGAGRLQSRRSLQEQPQSRCNTNRGMISQWWYLMHRDVAIRSADRWSTAILFGQAPILAALIALVFGAKATKKLTAETWSDVSTGIGMTCFLLALAAIWLGCSNAVREIVSERPIYRRERMAGLGVWPYLASKLFVLALLCGLQCLALTFVVRAGCGLRGSPGFAYAALWVAAMSGVVSGLCVSAVVRTTEAAASMLPLIILPMVILGGALLPLKELPPVALGVAEAMPSRWAFEAIVVNEAGSREVLKSGNAGDPPGEVGRDLAEAWFPAREWRSRKLTPLWVLTGLSAVGVFAAYAILAKGDRH